MGGSQAELREKLWGFCQDLEKTADFSPILASGIYIYTIMIKQTLYTGGPC